ncbi:hypothetical protein CORC01_12206 [Colletotrichum orchidophilum]|uniref:Uncharacterized protein n=1 Tax=Colletotrichum orchidophilum TaxID=1209926 RepID=A0A1G4ATL3_9PEZI|nr:uncharacterized protein CORC01_12206 [Colletotrichum orchidophilum]OHE92488.1 hypothetical protein CORC01_12206 [Colletotrichum orchidophilum]
MIMWEAARGFGSDASVPYRDEADEISQKRGWTSPATGRQTAFEVLQLRFQNRPNRAFILLGGGTSSHP